MLFCGVKMNVGVQYDGPHPAGQCNRDCTAYPCSREPLHKLLRNSWVLPHGWCSLYITVPPQRGILLLAHLQMVANLTEALTLVLSIDNYLYEDARQVVYGKIEIDIYYSTTD